MNAAIESINNAQPPDAAAPEGSDQALATQFAEAAHDCLRWSPGLGWMHNAGDHWERDDKLARFTLAKRVCAIAASDPDASDGTRYRLTSSRTINAIVSLSRDEQGIVTPVEQWDADPMRINTPAGAYDLTTGAEVNDGRLFRQVTAIAPDFEHAPERWFQFFAQVFNHDTDVIEFMQRMIGYCLTGSTREQKLFFLHGAGANGKSVLMDAIRAILGTYAVKMPAEALMTRAHEDHPTVYAQLLGRRLAISSEIESSAHWNESKLKELTGDDAISARFMRQDYFTFTATHKHVIAGNYRPRLRGDDFAMARRLVLIPFTQTFKGDDCDPELPDKIRAEYPGILAWAIQGARKWSQDGLRIPASIASASERYMRENDDVAMWLADCCTLGDQHQTPFKELYASFREWKEAAGEHAASNKAFAQQLERKGLTKTHTRAGNAYKGVMCQTTASSYAAAKWGEQ